MYLKPLTPERQVNKSGYRSYSPTLGRFVSRDPVEGDRGQNLFAFVLNSPVSHWDLLGLLSYTLFKTTTEFDERTCGGIRWEVDFTLSPATAAGGYIVQRVSMSDSVYDCKTKRPLTPLQYRAKCSWDQIRDEMPFYEIFGVVVPPVPTGGQNPFPAGSRRLGGDTWQMGGCGPCTYGKITVEGVACWHEGLTAMPADCSHNSIVGAFVCATRPTGACGNGLRRRLTVRWNCCGECCNGKGKNKGKSRGSALSISTRCNS